MQATFVQKQQFGLKMNPQMYQSLRLMELPLVDLREKIEQELEQNPALEVLEDRSTVSLDEGEGGQREVEEYFEASSDSGFIGGSGGAGRAGKPPALLAHATGEIGNIIKAVWDKNPNCRVVITAVTIETVSLALAAFKDAGADPEITQISASRGKLVGGLHMMEAQNPITILCAGGRA